ncbi:hypothetical protein ET495_15515 [Xylanimonas allomyrinae]|uniref:Uncharacterized protein n=1 Tax=Xylanimonas allomyrinae TaxID=2509459 RepID=A0A4P6ENT8_9MICO|nr:hypothetical protein [Xylanimonas allomyrinae]QAY64384.1 hypothetical protein ET495_15515 [Xylanimonas allomyrinae]
MELLGITMSVVVLVTAVTVAMVGFDLGPRVAAQLCKIVPGASCEEPGPARSAADHVPPEPCVVGGDGGAVRGSVAAGIKIDGGYTWFIEELGNGQYRLSRTAEQGVGAETGAGFDVSVTLDGSRFGAALSAGAAVTAALREGDVYYASSDAEAQEILHAALADDVKDRVVGDSWWGRDAVDWLTLASDKEQREPESTFVKAGVDATAQAAATLLDLDASAGVEAGDFLGRTTYRDGRTTDHFTSSSSASVQASTVTDQAGASAAGALGIELDRDKDGNPTAMRIVSTSSAHADVASWDNPASDPRYTQTTWEVPLKSAEDRAIAAGIARELGLSIVDLATSTARLAPDPTRLAASLAQFDNFAKTKGYVWVQEYELGDSTYGANFDAKWLLEAGLSAEYTGSSRKATSYKYWDGTQFADRAGCVA